MPPAKKAAAIMVDPSALIAAVAQSPCAFPWLALVVTHVVPESAEV